MKLLRIALFAVAILGLGAAASLMVPGQAAADAAPVPNCPPRC